MKKILFLAIIGLLAVSANAQYNVYPGVPLFGTAANQDRTYRDLQLGQFSLTDTNVVAADTITLIPGFVSGAGAVFQKNYYFTITDSAVLSIRDVSSSYTGSVIDIYLTSGHSTSWAKFLGYSGLATQWAVSSSGTKITMTANHWALIEFVCTGTAWIEKFRIQD